MADLNDKTELDALDKIAIEAAGSEAEAEAAQEAILNPNPEPVVDQAEVWAQIPAALGGLLAMAMPELRDVYTQEACKGWGQGMAAVSDKYGWDAGETIGKWTPEFMLVAASLPLIVPTVRVFKAYKVISDAKARGREVEVVAGPSVDPAGNPMMQPPGNFSVPV